MPNPCPWEFPAWERNEQPTTKNKIPNSKLRFPPAGWREAPLTWGGEKPREASSRRGGCERGTQMLEHRI